MKYSLNFNNHWLISWALSFIECFYHISPGHSQGSWSVVLMRYYGPVVSDQLFSSLSSSTASWTLSLLLVLVSLHPSSCLQPWFLACLAFSITIELGILCILSPQETARYSNSCGSVYLAIVRSYALSHLASQETWMFNYVDCLGWRIHHCWTIFAHLRKHVDSHSLIVWNS